MQSPHTPAVRNTSIDVARGLGIFFVVLGHNPAVLADHGAVFRAVFAFHMPLFFLLAGVFLNPTQSNWAHITARAHSLLKPYFVVLACLAIPKVIGAFHSGNSNTLTSYLQGMAYANGETLIWPPLWFLPHLFISSTLALLIVKVWTRFGLSERSITAPALALLLVGITTLQDYWLPGEKPSGFVGVSGQPGLPWSLDIAPITVACILMGYVLREPIRRLECHPIAAVCALLVFVGLQLSFAQTIDLNLRSYPMPWVCTAQAIAGVYVALQLAACLNRHSPTTPALRYLGEASLFLLIFHGWSEGKAFALIDQYTQSQLFSAMGSLVIGIAFPLTLWAITQRSATLRYLLLPPRRKVPATAGASSL